MRIVLLFTDTHTHTSFSVCSLEESSSIGQDQTLTERGVEGGTTEINCNGVIGIVNYPENSNNETLRLNEDLHNANDCDAHTLKQEPSFLNSPNGDSSASQETDSCTPVTSEMSETMVCQSSSVDQSLGEQDISQLQESIRAEIPSGDEQEQEHNGPLDNKGTTQTPHSPALHSVLLDLYKLRFHSRHLVRIFRGERGVCYSGGGGVEQTLYSGQKLPLSSISRKQLSKLLVVCKSVANFRCI